MKGLVPIAAAALALCATAAAADPVTNLADGLGALNRHDEETAARLLGDALSSHMLSAANQELALVKRGEALLLLGRADEALVDAREALAIDPHDLEAAEVRAYALSAGVPAPHGPIINRDIPLNAQVAARNVAVNAELDASRAQYQRDYAAYEAQKAANASAYAAQMSAYSAGVQAQAQLAAAAQAAWRAAVAACKAGDYSKCGKH